MFILTRRGIAYFFLALLLLSIPFQGFSIFPESRIVIYRIVNVPVLFLLALFFLKEDKIKFNLKSPTLVISLLFVVWILISCLFSKDVFASSVLWFKFVFEFFILSLTIFFCIKTAWAWNERFFIFIAHLMQLAGFIIGTSVLASFFFDIELKVFTSHTTWTDTASLLGGTFAMTMSLCIGFSMAVFLFSYYKKKNKFFKLYFCLFTALICLVALFISGSRLAGMLALFLMLMIAIRQGYFLFKSKQGVFIAVLLGVVISSIISGLFIMNTSRSNLETLRNNKYTWKIYYKLDKYLSGFEEIQLSQISRGSSLGQRLDLIKKAPEIIYESPIKNLLVGVGYGQFEKNGENAYLAFFVETGFVGGLLFLALIIQMGITIFRKYRQAENKDFIFYFGIAFLSMVIFFLFEPTLMYSRIWRFFIPLVLFYESANHIPARIR